MEALRPACPHLPEPDANMSHRCLTELTDAPREVFYYAALKYGNYLWQTGHSGRALLAVTRALYADVPINDPILNKWPLPYAAIYWIVKNHLGHDFPGNPRISFQHQATRIRGTHAELRKARAWAAWQLICLAQPDLLGDASQSIREPAKNEIALALTEWGHSEEAALWLSVVNAQECASPE